MLPGPAADDWTFPRSVVGAAVLVRYAAGHGVAPTTALVGTGLAPGDLDDATREVTAAQELRVVRTLRRELGDVGREVGRTYRASTFGAFGYAMLASRTVLDAMTTALRFFDLSFAFVIPGAAVVPGGSGDEVAVTLDATTLPDDVRRFLLERDATAVHLVLESLVPGGVGARLEVAGDRAVVRFGADQLARPLPERSAERLLAAEALCRDVVDRRRARTGFAADVRVLVAQRLRDGAPMADVASALGMTERTLRRRLGAAGTGYRELLDEVRSSVAAALTARPATLPLVDLAAHLGYGSPAAYLHARARWSPDPVRGPLDTAPDLPTIEG
ncbi:AraC family transcriptional regulator [Nocardioides dongxiaopingii]|uniref:AraC family transcriptional regulator ligand-binding domain-containing protein n=1 Tax=Nocardioides sp. S-1144 TaxID=2582905 RepID=UPI00110D5766|nr:AraC family transcriptional regulator ligand-binding domain-containing protein [Nocardioides sp. S-1144]QCW50580.1 AraC family transcriptional regulator [Nocardioides sp. S-1144]